MAGNLAILFIILVLYVMIAPEANVSQGEVRLKAEAGVELQVREIYTSF